MAKPKRTEVTLVASVLVKDHDSPEAAAEAVLVALDEKRLKDSLFVGVIVTDFEIQPGVFVRKGRGPWPTRHSALKDAMKLASSEKRGWPFYIVKLSREPL